jgi:hypothetical protein
MVPTYMISALKLSSCDQTIYSPKNERLVEDRVQVLAMDFRLKFLLPVWQEIYFDVRITAATNILHWKVLRLQHL